MANNEYVNKVLFGNTTVMDISDTTAEEGTVVEGYTFYTRSGAPATGTLTDATTSTHGLMSTTDKAKLDGITAGAAVTDVLIDSVSILSSGVANIPSANTVFYGLAAAAGDNSQASSNNAVGTYTTTALAAIQQMIGALPSIEVIRL